MPEATVNLKIPHIRAPTLLVPSATPTEIQRYQSVSLG
jgi:hypothetical protein